MRVFSFLTIMITALVLLAPIQAKAQFIDEASSPLDIAITYNKLAGQIPDFQLWASYTQEYGTALEQSKLEVLEEETHKLQKAFAFYDHTVTPITIRTLVNVSVKEGKNSSLSITFPNKKISYFPYTYANTNYALITENSDILADIPLGVLEAKQVKERLSADGKVLLILNVVPHQVNTKDQMKDKNLQWWTMLAKIGGVSLYNSELETVWSWKAEWYKRVIREQNGNVIAN